MLRSEEPRTASPPRFFYCPEDAVAIAEQQDAWCSLLLVGESAGAEDTASDGGELSIGDVGTWLHGTALALVAASGAHPAPHPVCGTARLVRPTFNPRAISVAHTSVNACWASLKADLSRFE